VEGLTAPLLALLQPVKPELREQFLTQVGLAIQVDEPFFVQYPAPTRLPGPDRFYESPSTSQNPNFNSQVG